MAAAEPHRRFMGSSAMGNASASAASHRLEVTAEVDFRNLNCAKKSDAKHLSKRAKSDENSALLASLVHRKRFIQSVSACLTAGLDDISDDVSLRLQNTRVAAVLSRRR